ncbi:leucyl aminopeptidase family protein [Leucobacter sp. G161]|uniref:M17 family metallopeptidase n=1 Tax=Leucobacter sp. G161 TaxID=663704 RepID=UPI00073CC928|nr:M17 family metallopeptidase [Leucobacter sp. G161]KUF07862.1 hypothetical protein AUL38_00900 [Leucobacter sp. G161]
MAIIQSTATSVTPTVAPAAHSGRDRNAPWHLPPIPTGNASRECLSSWGERAGELLRAQGGESGPLPTLTLTGSSLTTAEFRQILAGLLAAISGPSGDETFDLPVEIDIPAAEFTRAVVEEHRLHRAETLAKSLTDARSNQLTPAMFAERASEVAVANGLGFRLTTAPSLRAEGFGGITAIGQGSVKPPVLVELWFSGTLPPGDEPPADAIGLAGKGVTFDAGGLSLKPPSAMYSMHTDCAGAATVLATLSVLRDFGVTQPVYAALPLVENIPGPASIRPGDVVHTRSGVGVEIIDTDFEGRVVLADAIARLSEAAPRAVISVATLTYQIEVALGPEIAGLFARDHALGGRLLRAADQSAEALWEMPWATRYASQLRSTAPGATLRNHPLSDTGRAITAALFLGEFAPADVPFAHIDCSGPAVRATPDGPLATGYGVRTLVELLRQWD